MAEPTGFEPATSDVTGRRSNQLNYDSALKLLNDAQRLRSKLTYLNNDCEYIRKHWAIARKLFEAAGVKRSFY